MKIRAAVALELGRKEAVYRVYGDDALSDAEMAREALDGFDGEDETQVTFIEFELPVRPTEKVVVRLVEHGGEA